MKNSEGLPKIANLELRSKPIALIFLGLILILFASIYFFTRNKHEQSIKAIEETYILNSDAPVQVTANKVTNMTQPEISAEEGKQQLALLQAKQKELQQRLSAPLMLVNGSSESGLASDQSAQKPIRSDDKNTQFLQEISVQRSTDIKAKKIGPLNQIIAEGHFIHAILESAIDSDLPGSLRAVISEPVYSEDGSQILLPMGSRLLGQYKSGMLEGQSRVFVEWTRVITPQGISVQLASPGVDELGVAGIGADEIDRHFWQRFGTAGLLSLIGAGTANVGVSNAAQDNSAAMYRSAVASSFAQSANQSLQQTEMIPPTLRIHQGEPIMVFVAHDLNFQNAFRNALPKIQVF